MDDFVQAQERRNESVFDKLGVAPVINASGIYTDLGGSILSESLWSDLTALNEYYVDMTSLLDETGEIISRLVGSKAARVTPGASAGIALSVAAAMAGDQGANWEKLPDTSGMPNEVILQKRQVDEYKYLNPLRLTGAAIRIAGDESGTTEDDIVSLINDRTAAIFVPAHLDSMDNIVSMERVGVLAKESGVKFLIDAAYQVFPPELMRIYSELGADLTMISSKYFFGPNAGGFVCGTREMVDIVTGLDFTRFESGAYRTFGRPFKMGRYEVAATCLALQDWFARDHEARWAGYADKAQHITEIVNALEGFSARKCCFTFDETIEESPVNCSMIICDRPELSAGELVRRLEDGRPSIHAVPFDGKVLIVTETLRDGDEEIIADRIRQVAKEAS